MIVELSDLSRDVFHEHETPLQKLGNGITTSDGACGIPEKSVECEYFLHHLTFRVGGGSQLVAQLRARGGSDLLVPRPPRVHHIGGIAS